MSDPSPDPRPILEIDGLRKRYGKLDVLNGLSLSVREGEVYGFLGRNGAGKSTTIRILMGISKHDGGEVRLFGEKSGAASIPVRQRVGYVAQEQNFYGWMTPTTLGGFVSAFYPTWDDGEFDRLVRQMGLPPDRKVGTFSGGMKVKLGLALALSHRPQLLILDEPMAGLDPVARREFLEMIREQAERTGRTTFFSTHLIDEIELAAHRVGIVDGGTTRYEGTVQDLAARIRLLRHPLGEEEPVLPSAVVDPEGGLDVLSNRKRDGQQLLVVMADDVARFDGLLDEEHGWAYSDLSLEDAFVELVRTPLRRED